MYCVLLFYKYRKINDPQKKRDEQFELCSELGLKGRIIIAEEGINGTVCGLSENVAIYKNKTTQSLGIGEIEFKEDISDNQVFPRLKVKMRNEIVTLGVENVSADTCAEYITPEELNSLMHSGEEYYLLDARNEYEWKVGKFRGAITPEVKHFRDLPAKLKEYEYLKNKKLITYCTGGVRCEKFSALLKNQGFSDVKQLHGGVVNYGRNFPDDGWEGKLYVFDDRITVDINSPEKEVLVSNCNFCRKSTARIINCANADCDEQYVCCEECQTANLGFCSESCKVDHKKLRAKFFNNENNFSSEHI